MHIPPSIPADVSFLKCLQGGELAGVLSFVRSTTKNKMPPKGGIFVPPLEPSEKSACPFPFLHVLKKMLVRHGGSTHFSRQASPPSIHAYDNCDVVKINKIVAVGAQIGLVATGCGNFLPSSVVLLGAAQQLVQADLIASHYYPSELAELEINSD